MARRSVIRQMGGICLDNRVGIDFLPPNSPRPESTSAGGICPGSFLLPGLGPRFLPPQLTDPKPPRDSDPYLDSPRFAAGAGGDVP